MITSVLAAVQSTVPPTPAWTPTVGIVMLLANVFAIVVGRFAIQNPGKGPSLPLLPDSGIWKNFGVPELLATTSLGHVIGAGVILGLSNAGLL
jgi:photosystem I subunit 10